MPAQLAPIYSSTKRIIAQIPSKILKHILLQNQKGLKYLSRGDLKNAIRYFNKAIKKSKYYFAAYNNLALAYFISGDYKRAISYAKQALKVDPENVFSLSIIAEAYLAQDNKEEAQKYLQKALNFLSRSKYDENYITKVIEAVVAYGEDKVAYSLYKHYRESLKESSVALLASGIAAVNIKKYNDAKNMLAKVKKKFRYVPELLFLIEYANKMKLELPRLGIDVFSSDLLAKQQQNMKRLLKDDYIKTRMLYSIFQEDLKLKNKIKNIQFLVLTEDPKVYKFLKGLLMDNDFPFELKKRIIYLLMANGFFKENEKVKLMHDGKKITVPVKDLLREREEQLIRLLLDYGLALKQSGKLDDAEKVFRKGLEKYPNTVAFMVNLANVLREKKQFDEAEALLKKSLTIEDNPISKLNLVALYLQTDRLDDAVELFSKIDKDKISNKSVMNMYIFIEKMFEAKGIDAKRT